MTMKNAVFWDVTPCRSCVNMWLQTTDAGSSLVDFLTLKMEAIRSSETSVHTRSTRLHIPEDGILHVSFCPQSVTGIYVFRIILTVNNTNRLAFLMGTECVLY
jgi:hypothetical protein